jgi:hypothetical protein
VSRLTQRQIYELLSPKAQADLELYYDPAAEVTSQQAPAVAVLWPCRKGWVDELSFDRVI